MLSLLTIDRHGLEPRRSLASRVRLVMSAWFANHAARRQLLCCSLLDARFANDIGLTPDELATICAAPFWRALERPGATTTPRSSEHGARVRHHRKLRRGLERGG
jgi:hypothetical protein